MAHAIIQCSHRGHRQLAWIGTLALLAACADSPERTTKPSPLPETKAVISASSAAPESGASAIGIDQAYVSMAPGTEPGGDSVTIEHFGGGPSVGTRMRDGGFDPVAIEAEAGDTLAVSVHRGTGATITTFGVVPIKARPKVVRTSPAASKTDVPLNPVILVVFNEPMDSMSLSDALHLRLHGVDVPATVTGESMAGVILIGKFVPTSPLEPASSYQFSVSTAARDLGGTPLEGPVEINFTTADTSSIPTPSDTSSQPLAPQISALSPTSAAAGSPDLTLTITGTNFDGTAQNQGQVVWVANGQTTSLETTFVSSTQLTALVPAALLSNSGTIQVLLYRPLRSNMVSFLVIAPPPPLGQSTIIVNGQLSGYPAPLGFLGWREVSLDKSPSQTLREGGSVTFSPVAPGTHQLVLSNPCTWTHQPSGQTVTTVADQTVTVTVYVPPDCE